MDDDSIKQATGRSREAWFSVIRQAVKAEASHKQIADYLHETQDLSYWWAQEITVEYERHIGRRVLGQTQDGLFQIGVRKTIAASSAAVWEFLQSPRGISLLTCGSESGKGDQEAATTEGMALLESLDGENASGIRVSTTTFEAGSHVRMRWQRRGWPSHSILQVRVMPQSETKTILSFHQEKLPSQDERREMAGYWRSVAEEIAEVLSADAGQVPVASR